MKEGRAALFFFGILTKKSVALCGVSAFLYYSTFVFLKHILIFGTYGEGNRIVLSSVIFALMFFLLRDQTLRSHFTLTEKDLRNEKVIHRLGTIFLIVILAYYGYSASHKIRRISDLFASPVQLNLSSNGLKSEEDYSVKSIFGWQILVPKDVNIKTVYTKNRKYADDFQKDPVKSKEDADKIVLYHNKEGTITIYVDKNNPIFDNNWSDVKHIMGINNRYELIRKMHYEKVGLMFLSLKSLVYFNDPQVYEIETGQLKGFINKILVLFDDWTMYEVLLFDGQDNYIDISYKFRANRLSEKQIFQMILGIRKSPDTP